MSPSPADPSPVLASRWDPRVVVPRLPGLLIGLILIGVGIAAMARSGLGLSPWEVLNQGLGRVFGVPMGTVSIVLGVPIMLSWWPLGDRPGVGTVLNLLLIGTTTNFMLGVIGPAGESWQAAVLSGVGIVLCAVGTALYLAADLGPGPRDGLMTGLHFRFGWSLRRTRTSIELVVVVVGWLVGGTVGIGTVVLALAIGPIVQALLGVFDREGRLSARRRAALEARGMLAE